MSADAPPPPPATSSDPPPPPPDPDGPLSRGYLSLRQAGAASDDDDPAPAPAPAPPDDSRCRAMMEVVRKDGADADAGGTWKVSKLLLDHNHDLQASASASASTVPALGMEFDSVHDAKGCYYGYGDAAGFKARTGSNRRSAGTGAMIMQRFLCCRGNYSYKRAKSAKDLDAAKQLEDGAVGNEEGKAGACNKRGRKPGKKTAQAIEAEKVVVVATASTENAQGVPTSRMDLRRGRGKKDLAVADKDVDSVVKPLQANSQAADVAQDGAPDGGADGDNADGNAVEDETEKVAEVKEKRGRGRPRKAVAEGSALQACVSSDLSVTAASQSTNVERKNLLNKYLEKRQSRPAAGRPAKIVSRQALAERRQRGDGGRFLASEGVQPSGQPSERRSKRLEKQNPKKEEMPESKEDEIIEAEPDPETEVVAGPGGQPKVGMVFLNEDKAYEFYVSYGGTAGFNVRKGCSEKTSKNVRISRAYVCSKEGFRPKTFTAEPKKQRPETRTGCQAHMTVKITTSGKYVVTEYVADHNHDLEAPLVDIQIVRSHNLLAKLQQPPDPPKVVLIPDDYKNYIRTRRTKDMQLGDAGAICEYLQRMKGENPSFYYSIQVDEEDQFTNVFWADVKSMMDYNYFGDVVCLDTRYSTSDYGRPLLLFIGVNNHKQPIIFGAAFIYDESVESFKWLFETFKSAMSGKQPKTILTDRSTSVRDAVASAWPGTVHRFSLLHLYQNATKSQVDPCLLFSELPCTSELPERPEPFLTCLIRTSVLDMAVRSWNPFSCCVRGGAVADEYDDDSASARRIGRRGKGSLRSSSRMSFRSLSSSGTLSPEDLSLTMSGSNLHAFTYAELRVATGNFSRANYLGSGGFGPVYKGVVNDKLRPGLAAQAVAVKYLDLECGTQGHKEWLAEVFFLGQLRHKNLVKLIGYCYEDKHRMLVYEFMSAGSLENHLFKSINGSLPWMTRMKIAVGAAKGLAFLHDADPPVIYRDFKASNILLDSDYNTKLSDFGLAKDGPEGDETHVTTRVMGTHGYAAPEYIMTGHLTAKSDVYSFGVVLLELLSGLRSVDRARRPREQNLVDWARPYLKRSDRLYKVMDPALECQYSCKGAEVAALVAYKCLSQNPKSRPTMREVVKALEPVLSMDDFFPVGPFVFTVIVEEDKVVDMKVEVEKHQHHRQNHEDRHRQKYPDSAIHTGIVLHGHDGLITGYTGAQRRQQRSLSYRRERGA